MEVRINTHGPNSLATKTFFSDDSGFGVASVIVYGKNDALSRKSLRPVKTSNIFTYLMPILTITLVWLMLLKHSPKQKLLLFQELPR